MPGHRRLEHDAGFADTLRRAFTAYGFGAVPQEVAAKRNGLSLSAFRRWGILFGYDPERVPRTTQAVCIAAGAGIPARQTFDYLARCSECQEVCLIDPLRFHGVDGRPALVTRWELRSPPIPSSLRARRWPRRGPRERR